MFTPLFAGIFGFRCVDPSLLHHASGQRCSEASRSPALILEVERRVLVKQGIDAILQERGNKAKAVTESQRCPGHGGEL